MRRFATINAIGQNEHIKQNKVISFGRYNYVLRRLKRRFEVHSITLYSIARHNPIGFTLLRFALCNSFITSIIQKKIWDSYLFEYKMKDLMVHEMSLRYTTWVCVCIQLIIGPLLSWVVVVGFNVDVILGYLCLSLILVRLLLRTRPWISSWMHSVCLFCC